MVGVVRLRKQGTPVVLKIPPPSSDRFGVECAHPQEVQPPYKVSLFPEELHPSSSTIGNMSCTSSR